MSRDQIVLSPVTPPEPLGSSVRAYVGWMLRLTSLAPDIIEAILHGGEPDGLSLEKLRKNLPAAGRPAGAVG